MTSIHPKNTLSEIIIKKLSLAVGITSAITLITVFLFPLFSDEIQIRMWLSRLPYEFPNRVTGVARCFTSFSQAIPYPFYPAAFINWLTHGLIESPSILRGMGIIFLLSWILPLIIYFHKKERKQNILLIFSITLGLFFIGLNPIFISINRSEQFYYPSLIILLIISLYDNKIKCFKFLIIKFLALYLLFSLILYGHPKGLFFLPFFVSVLWLNSYKLEYKKSIFILTSILLAYISLESFRSWSGAFICKEIPEYENFLKSFSFDPLSIFYNPIDFLKKAQKSLIRFDEYPSHFEFKREYIWNFLPGIKNFTIFHSITNLIIKLFVIAIYFVTLFSALYLSIKNLKKRNDNILLLSLLICTTIWAIFNLTKNIYDAYFFYSITVLVLIFILITNNVLRNKLFKLFLLFLLPLTLISQVTFIANNLFPFIRGFSGPGIKIGLYESQHIHNSIRDASQACEIHPTNGKYIVIDDLTYGFFRKSHGPISFTYNRVGTTKTPLQDLFRTVDSDGMILDCNNMPEKFRAKSTRVNNICCLSKSDIKKNFLNVANSELN